MKTKITSRELSKSFKKKKVELIESGIWRTRSTAINLIKFKEPSSIWTNYTHPIATINS